MMLLHRKNFKRQITVRETDQVPFSSSVASLKQELSQVGFSASLASLKEELIVKEEIERGESVATTGDRFPSEFDLLKKEDKFCVQTLESYQAYSALGDSEKVEDS